MQTFKVQYTTEPNWEGCGCCVYWEAELTIVDNSGDVVYHSSGCPNDFENFEQVVEHLRTNKIVYNSDTLEEMPHACSYYNHDRQLALEEY